MAHTYEELKGKTVQELRDSGELSWLGDTVAAVADSWLRLDGTLLSGVVAPHGQVTAE